MAAGAAAAAAAIIQAIKASGVIVNLDPPEFQKLLLKLSDPLIVTATGGVFRKTTQYLTSYKGIAFYTDSPNPIDLPTGAEVVTARRIWVPG